MNMTVRDLLDIYIDDCFTVILYAVEDGKEVWRGWAWELKEEGGYADAQIGSIDTPTGIWLGVNIDF